MSISKYIPILFFTLILSQNIEILDIKIEGIKRLKENDVFRISKLYPGIKLSRGDEINKAINKLWEVGRFSDIQFYLEEESEDGIILKIILDELPVIGEIKYIGNKKNRDKTLDDVIKITSGQIISENTLFKTRELIINRYKDDKFHNVSINYEIEDTEIDYIKNLIFYIDEGQKSRIRKIDIRGNDNFPFHSLFNKNKLSKILKNTKEFKWYAPWKGKFNEINFEKDLKSLELFYKNHGYRDFTILSEDVIYSGKRIEINLDIYEGEKYFYKEINFVNNEKFSNQELLEKLDIGVGDQYSKEELDFAIFENINSLYMDEGHYFFNIDKEIIPDNDSLIVNLTISENQKVKIRKIYIKGNDKTIESVIRRELKIYPGDIFNRRNIIESMKSLYMLNYFETVEPQILTVSDNEVDISMNVVEKETGRVNFSMGYNEYSGFSGGGGFEFSNFLGRGLKLQIDYQKGLQNQINSGFSQSTNNNSANYESFSISFTEPRILDSRNSIGFSLYKQEQGARSGYSDYDIENIGGSISFGRRFKWPDYYTGGSWSIGIRNSKYFGSEEDLHHNFSDNLIYQEGNNFYARRYGVKLTQTISRTNVDNAEFTTTGSKLVWSSTFSGGILGGNENYHKHIFNFKWYTPFSKKVVFFQNYIFGAIKPLVKDEYIGYRTRFALGGTGIPYGEMLRGYTDSDLGPRIPGTYSHGGNILFKYSTELRFFISSSPTIYFILFAEAGGVWEDFNNVDIFSLKRSAGLGIRLNMPMLGMLGLDFGYGFDKYDDPLFEDSPRWEQHLLFGVPLN